MTVPKSIASSSLPSLVLLLVGTATILLIAPSLTTLRYLRHLRSFSLSFSSTSFHPLSLRAPAPLNDSVHDELRALLWSVNGTLLANPKTSKQFVMYRAVGNDLPPRHSTGQAFENVRFMLQHEETFHNLDIRWYLNRIIDQNQLLKIARLLVEYKQQFVIDFFDFQHFDTVDVNLYGYKPVDVLRANFFYRNDSLANHARREIKDDIFKQFNHYIIHNNQARNKMLALGIQTGAKYILPWDGNCFLTKNAWDNITSTINFLDDEVSINVSRNNYNKTFHKFTASDLTRKRYTNRYYYVPMVRITDNDQLRNASYFPDTIDEEPQIIFRNDATQRFNESLAYGCRPKVELLWRLRVPGWWNKQHKHPTSCMTYNRTMHKLVDFPLNMRIAPSGWVARLFSGVAHLEVDGALLLRGSSRSDAIEIITARTMAVVGRSVNSFNLTRSKLLLYDERVLQANVQRVHSSARLRNFVRARLLKVTRSRSLRGKKIPNARHLIAYVFDVLFTNNTSHLGKIRAFILSFFDTVHPLNDNELAIERGMNLCLVLEAVKIIYRTPHAALFSADEYARFADWTRTRAWWIAGGTGNSTLSVDEYYAANWRATLHDVQSACVSAFVGDAVAVLRHTLLARGRMLSHFRHTYSLWRDGLRGVLAWTIIAGISEQVGGANGVDIWTFRNLSSPLPEVSDTFLLYNASRHIVPLALRHAAFKFVGLPVGYHAEGGISSSWAWNEELCAGRAVEYIIWHAYRRFGVHINESTAFKLGSVLDEDPCIDGNDNFLPPFWNLATVDLEMEGRNR